MEPNYFLQLIPEHHQHDPEDWDSLTEFLVSAFHESYHLDETSPPMHAALKHAMKMVLFSKGEQEELIAKKGYAEFHNEFYKRLANRVKENGWESIWSE